MKGQVGVSYDPYLEKFLFVWPQLKYTYLKISMYLVDFYICSWVSLYLSDDYFAYALFIPVKNTFLCSVLVVSLFKFWTELIWMLIGGLVLLGEICFSTWDDLKIHLFGLLYLAELWLVLPYGILIKLFWVFWEATALVRMGSTVLFRRLLILKQTLFIQKL